MAEDCDWDVLWRTITRQEIWADSRNVDDHFDLTILCHDGYRL